MTAPLRVAMVGPYPVGRTLSNGVEAVGVEVVDLLRKRHDVDVEVVTCVFGSTDKTVVQDGVTIHVVGSSDRFRRLTFYRLERSRIAKRLKQIAPDIVHAQGANFYGAGALDAGLPSVVTLHGMLFKEAKITDSRSERVRQMQTQLRGYFNAKFEERVLQRSTDIITISDYVNACIDGRTDAQLHAIANPISETYFELEKVAEAGRLLCVARIEPRKGQHHLVHATRRLIDEGHDVHLRLVGKPVDAGYADSVTNLVLELELQDHVTLTGIVSDEELLDEYRRADVVVMSSREETSPMTLQQAMACSTAVAGPANAGIPYLIEHEENGLLVTEEPLDAGLATALGALLNDNELRNRLAKGGRSTAERRFRADRVGDDTVSVYRSVLG